MCSGERGMLVVYGLQVEQAESVIQLVKSRTE